MVSGLVGYQNTPEDIKEITDELNAYPVKCVNVRMHHTPSTRRNGLETGKFVVTYPTGTKLAEVTQKFLGHMRVQFNHLERTAGQMQCHRCQGDHPTMRCRRPPRCVKCGEGHFTAECKLKMGEPVKCCLCGGLHTANFLGCPVHKENKKRTEDRRKKNIEVKNPGNQIKVWNVQEGRDRFNRDRSEHQQPRQQQQQIPTTDEPPAWAKELIKLVNNIDKRLSAIEDIEGNNYSDYDEYDIDEC